MKSKDDYGGLITTSGGSKGPMPTSYSEIDDVRNFMKMLGYDLPEKPVHVSKESMRRRAAFIQEELNELKRGIEAQDAEEIADGVVDVVYAALGAALMLGLPWVDLWNEVARANWEKEPGSTARSRLDALKPPGWKRPDVGAVLRRAGYVRVDFEGNGTGEVDERRTRDYEEG